MSCEREELLSRYIDGDVTAQESSEIRRHLSSCRECQAAFHEIQQREKTLKDVLQPVIESMHLRDAVMRRITVEGLRPEPNGASSVQAAPVRASRFLAFAVAFMLVVACGLIFYMNRPREAQEKEILDMIVVMGLGEQSSFGRKIMARGNTCYGVIGAGIPVRGRLAIFVNGQHVNPVVFDGSATVTLRSAGIDWTSGDAIIETPAAPEFTLNIGEDRIRMTDATLDIGGTAASYSLRLRRGTAIRIRRDGSENLPLVKPVSLTPGTASPSFAVASGTASPAHLVSSPALEIPFVASPTVVSSSAVPYPVQNRASEAGAGEKQKPVISPFGGRPVTKLEGE